MSSFPNKFDWTDLTFSHEQKKPIKNLLAKYHKRFAKHRLGPVKGTDCPVKLTLELKRPIYSSNSATAIYLRDELIVD